jgi:hypothetical protein
VSVSSTYTTWMPLRLMTGLGRRCSFSRCLYKPPLKGGSRPQLALPGRQADGRSAAISVIRNAELSGAQRGATFAQLCRKYAQQRRGVLVVRVSVANGLNASLGAYARKITSSFATIDENRTGFDGGANQTVKTTRGNPHVYRPGKVGGHADLSDRHAMPLYASLFPSQSQCRQPIEYRDCIRISFRCIGFPCYDQLINPVPLFFMIFRESASA